MNIISKEMITDHSDIPVIIVGGLAIAMCVFILIYLWRTKNADVATRLMCWTASIGLPLIMVMAILSSIFLRYDTGRYRYTATFDDSVSVEELEENYTNIQFDGEVWTFVDKDVKQ